MTAIPHVITGAAIGALSPNPAVAIAGGFFSHFVLDFIPHWDPSFDRKNPKRFSRNKLLFIFLLVIDLGISFAILVSLFKYPQIFLGGIAGILPDVDNFLQHILRGFPLLSKVGITIHDDNSLWHNNTKFIYAVFTQGIVTLIGSYIIYLKLLG